MELTLILIIIAILLLWGFFKEFAAEWKMVLKPAPDDNFTRSDGPPKGRRERDLPTLVSPLLLPTNLLRKTGKISTSYFGGRPPQVPSLVWPRSNGQPLDFLACLDLSRLTQKPHWLPEAGLLLFFYDIEKQPWGSDFHDGGGWAVIHVEDPTVVKTPGSNPGDPNAIAAIPQRFIRFEPVAQPPLRGEHALANVPMSAAEANELQEMRNALYGEYPEHQLGGYPTSMQSDLMPVECELIAIGVPPDSDSDFVERHMDRLVREGTEWCLLLQVDTDEDLDVMWGDAGMLYFWIRESDARRGDFSKVWLILQCG
jgi:hypothetical protein